MRNLEQELKLSLTEREYGILKKYSGEEPVTQTNYYFLSGRMPKEEMVRLREKNGKYVLCYKKRLSERDSVQVSDEREVPVSAETAEEMIKNGVTKMDALTLLNAPMAENLICVGTLVTNRIKFAMGEWILELDENVYFGVRDFELECESNSVERLEKLKSYLAYKFGIVLKTSQPKLHRFLKELKKEKITSL